MRFGDSKWNSFGRLTRSLGLGAALVLSGVVGCGDDDDDDDDYDASVMTDGSVDAMEEEVDAATEETMDASMDASDYDGSADSGAMDAATDA